ncbi:MAG: ATP-binding protein [Fibrobacteres bacterium]|nr:ATP-binding protein [Fibrobacterota bacterium]
MKSLRGTDTEDILEVIHRRHGTTSTVVATNRPVVDWGAFLGDAAAASAILDRPPPSRPRSSTSREQGHTEQNLKIAGDDSLSEAAKG